MPKNQEQEYIELEALMGEFNSLRSEISQRVQNQLYIVGGNVLLLTGIAPLLMTFFERGAVTIVLISPLIFHVVAWLYYEQDIFITQAATYLHKKLRQEVISRSKKGKSHELMAWEKYRAKLLFKNQRNRNLLRLMTFYRLLATLGPAIIIFSVTLASIFINDEIRRSLSIVDYVLILLNIVGLIYLSYLSNLVIKLYFEIAGE